MSLDAKSVEEIQSMSYVDLMAHLDQTNRPPGARGAIETLVSSCHVDSTDHVLDIGCNTGHLALEVARITDCEVTGVDLNEKMVERARERAQKDPCGDRVSFEVADAESLPFDDGRFSRVVCGGSTPFVQDREQALSEYRRVVKPWGFVGESNYYYETEPPKQLLDDLSKTLGAEIEPWGFDYWRELYDQAEFELYRTKRDSLSSVPDSRIREYTRRLADRSDVTGRKREELVRRLNEIFSLFNKNYEYLAYAVFVLRKRPVEKRMNPFDQEVSSTDI